MRLILTFLTIITIGSCKSIPKSAKGPEQSQPTSTCPKDGNCRIEIFKNSSLNVKTDEFDALYPILVDGNSIVIKYEYIRNEIPNTADSGYQELIYMQLNPDTLELQLQDNRLEEVNLLFGRLCFCKGQTGYYKINSGSLKIFQIKEDTYHIKLNFVSEQVPQIINYIDEIIKL